MNSINGNASKVLATLRRAFPSDLDCIPTDVGFIFTSVHDSIRNFATCSILDRNSVIRYPFHFSLKLPMCRAEKSTRS